MTDFVEAVSNPIAPDAFVGHAPITKPRLSNSDFRKLLMTPRPTPQTAGNEEHGDNSTHHFSRPSDRLSRKTHDSSDHGSRHKHKPGHKRHLLRHKRDQQKDNSTENSHRYRDRAKERRDGKLITPTEELENEREAEIDEDALTHTADYRAVAPTTSAGASHAERRRMLIQESKYLGGDMEHTHLVKGLDYVLLQKVRLEIENKELEAEQVLDAELNKPEKNKEIVSDDSVQYRTRLAANICDIITNRQLPDRNEYFQPGRMAYRIELEDDSVDFEVPATVIRSKADCFQIDGRSSGAITTNEIVINKLTQILSYLRAGKRHAKKSKLKSRPGEPNDVRSDVSSQHNPATKIDNIDIFEGVGSDYVPTLNSHSRHSNNKSSKHSILTSKHDLKDGSRNVETTVNSSRPKSSYFEVPIEKEEGTTNSLNAAKEFMNELNQRFGSADGDKLQEKASLERFVAKTQVTCYDECYPGFAESYDDDSDDEADFSKMDLGNKKGPVGRWDFETQEEYSDYMSNKEALPKAAFQYGVKMADGRRTRRIGPKDEKAELDRQLQKIQSIIQKRKQVAEDGGPMAKNPHF